MSRVRSGMRIWRAGAGRDGDADINEHAIPGTHNPGACHAEVQPD